MRESRLRWGVISTAEIAADVIPGLQRSRQNELVAVASRSADNARRFADEWSIPHAYSSYEALLDDDTVDCVYVPVPNHLHATLTRSALLAGKHVLCEKPFVVDADEAAGLFSLAHERRLHLAEAFMYRHHPKTHLLKELVTGGQIGEIHTVRAWFTYRARDAANDIRFDPAMAGGALRDVGSYPVSMSNYLIGDEPSTFAAEAVRTAQGVDERFYGVMGYSGGPVAIFDCSMSSHLGYGVSVVGTEGTATLTCPWYSHKAPHDVTLITPSGLQRTEVGDENAYFLETENFAAVVNGFEIAEISGMETVRTVRTLERLDRAAHH